MQRRLPSTEIRAPTRLRRSVKAKKREVRTLLRIHEAGCAEGVDASFRASTQKLAFIILKGREAGALRMNEFIKASSQRKPRRIDTIPAHRTALRNPRASRHR